MFNGGNMQQMMKQAQKLQKQMEENKKNLDSQVFVGKSTQDYVKVTVSGDKIVKAIEIAEALVDPDDVETLQDLVVDAVNDAMKQINQASEKSLGQFGKGLF
ncbi:MAG: YbaB/EbfC family nucleoid-associated protein [Streptococcaceae bacterium]|nr:YbaB/EbfC family nucleoid-associated protein [Streptococcaceae bacterium]